MVPIIILLLYHDRPRTADKCLSLAELTFEIKCSCSGYIGSFENRKERGEKRQSFQSTCSTILLPFGSTTVISQTAVLKLFVSVGVPYPILCPVGTPKLTQVE